MIANDLFKDLNAWKYICTNNFNQDALENLFSIVRYKKRKPTVKEFRKILKRIMSVKLIYSSKYANCKGGINNMLIDWKAVLSDSNNIQELDEVELFSSTSDFDLFEEQFDDDTEDTQSESELTKIDCAPLSDNAVTYFCGYVIHHKISAPVYNEGPSYLLRNCSSCLEQLSKQNAKISAPSDWLTFFKNFNDDTDFGSLKMPSEEFFNVCKSAFIIFSTFFYQDTIFTRY